MLVPRKIKKPEEFTAIAEAVSTTGKYAIALGKHFNPMICYDVIAINRATGVATRRHYKGDQSGAYIFWQEFRDKMTSPRQAGEEGEKDEYTIIRPN